MLANVKFFKINSLFFIFILLCESLSANEKNQIISNFSKIDNEYFLKIVDIKNPLKNNKDLFQLFKIKEDINYINNKEFSYRDDINYLRELLMFENLTSNPSKVDNKKYLDRLLLI